MTTDAKQSQSNGSNVPKEGAMSTSNTNPEASSGTPTDSANSPSDTEKVHRKALYDASKVEKGATLVVQSATGITEPAVQADVAGVNAGVDLVKQTSADIATATARQEQAVKARTASLLAVAMTFAAVEAMLDRVLPGGRAYLKRCRGRDSATTAINVVEHLPAGDLGLPTELMTPLRTAVEQAKPTITSAHEALMAKRQAVREFMAAKRELRTAIELLKRSIERFRLTAGLSMRPPPHHKPTQPATSPQQSTTNPPELNGVQASGPGAHAV